MLSGAPCDIQEVLVGYLVYIVVFVCQSQASTAPTLVQATSISVSVLASLDLIFNSTARRILFRYESDHIPFCLTLFHNFSLGPQCDPALTWHSSVTSPLCASSSLPHFPLFLPPYNLLTRPVLPWEFALAPHPPGNPFPRSLGWLLWVFVQISFSQFTCFIATALILRNSDPSNSIFFCSFFPYFPPHH